MTVLLEYHEILLWFEMEETGTPLHHLPSTCAPKLSFSSVGGTNGCNVHNVSKWDIYKKHFAGKKPLFKYRLNTKKISDLSCCGSFDSHANMHSALDTHKKCCACTFQIVSTVYFKLFTMFVSKF